MASSGLAKRPPMAATVEKRPKKGAHCDLKSRGKVPIPCGKDAKNTEAGEPV